MNKIFMTCLNRSNDNQEATLAVFMKGNKEKADDLMGFLKNQNIDITFMPEVERKNIPEFAYFDEGFKINIHTNRWSFYELRSYITSYTNTLDEDSLLRETMSKELRTCDENKVFDDRFFVELSRKIDAWEDLYYEVDSDIAIFMNGILKILSENLELNWAAAKIKKIKKETLVYLCHVPTKLPQHYIHSSLKELENKLIIKPIIFCGEHLADIIMSPSPYSPKKSVINKFIDFIIMHIDDFIYGDFRYKKRVTELENEIAELKKIDYKPRPIKTARTEFVKKQLNLIILGDSQINNDIILSLCKKQGFDPKNVELHTDYSKLPNFDTNILLKRKTKYDGILIGPIPHSMKNGFDLIRIMETEPRNYPPFTMLHNRDSSLKITRNTLEKSLKNLIEKIMSIDEYAVA